MLKAKISRRQHDLKDQALNEIRKEEIMRLNVNISKSLLLRFKSKTAQQGLAMTDILIKMVKDYVED